MQHHVLLTGCLLLPLVLADTGTYSPPAPPPTRQKCHVEDVELYAEVCTPTIDRQCEKVVVKSHTLETREDCVDVVRTVCTEAEEEVDNEVCYYVYNKETLETEATTLTVDYEVKCEEETSRDCPPTSNYGGYAGAGGYCKEEKAEVCYNLPTVSPAKTEVTVGYPVAEKKCENKPVKIPTVSCTEETEKKCFQLPYTKEEKEELERCTTVLGPPKCEQTPVVLPKQICVEIEHLPVPVVAPVPLPPVPHHFAVQPVQHASLPYLG